MRWRDEREAGEFGAVAIRSIAQLHRALEGGERHDATAPVIMERCAVDVFSGFSVRSCAALECCLIVDAGRAGPVASGQVTRTGHRGCRAAGVGWRGGLRHLKVQWRRAEKLGARGETRQPD
jgi:hypothetical protein